MAPTKEISLDAAVKTVLSEADGIFTLKAEQDNMFSLPSWLTLARVPLNTEVLRS